MNHHRSTEETILEQALAFASAEARRGYLQGACGGDEQLRARVQALIDAHEAAGGFLADTTTVGMPDVPASKATTKLGLDNEPPDEAVGQTIGRYKLLERIGEGGCGVVYVAEQTHPVRRRVALKVIKLGMDTKQVVARFEAERQALAMMDHPNIAKVLDAGTTETGRPFFVMELVRGIRITDYCDQAKLSTHERLDLFIKVCQAIQHAHQKGIIHRDIKPSNILVTLHDGVPVPKVIDFGIAKATEGRLTDVTVYTQLHQFIGTPAYMSPEQAEMSGLDIDTRSDIYSLGVLLYELLAGSTPFDAQELMASGLDAMRRTIREKEPVRPSTRFATLKGEELTTTAKRRSIEAPKLIHLLKGDLDWIVMKCLEKDRTRRFETASGLAADLKRHLNSEPVAARPPSAAYKFQKFARRNQTAFAAATVVVLALLLGVIVSTWQAVVANRAKTRAQQSETQAVVAQREAERAQQAEQQARLRADAERAEAAHNLYLANMTLAQQAWDENNMERLRQALEETKDSPHRGFEWYYWQKQTHLALMTLRGHLEPLMSAVYSPDGHRILTGSGDHTAKVWDAVSGRELLRLKGHSQYVVVAYSPDGKQIATGSADGTVRIWQATTGRHVITIKWPEQAFRSITFSPDGQRMVAGGYDGSVKVWEVPGGRELLTFMGHSNQIYSVAFSPDGQRIVTAAVNEATKVWDASTGQELLRLDQQDDGVYQAAYSPDGRRIVTADMGKTAKVWDAAGGRELLTLKGHADQVMCVAYSPDGKRIATGSFDRTAKVWDATSGKELFTLKGHSDVIDSVAFSPDGQRIVTGSWDGSAKVWEAAASRDVPPILGQTGAVYAAVCSFDGERIITGFPDKTLEVREAATYRRLLTLQGHGSNVCSAAFSPDDRRIVTGSEDKTAIVWDATTGQELLTLNGHDGSVSSVVFAPDGQRILTGSWDMTAMVWDASTGRQVLVLPGHTDLVNCAAFSPDGRRIVTGSVGEGKVWDAASGRELVALKGHRSWFMSVAFSADGLRIATGCDDGTAQVWDATSGRELLTLKGHSSGAFSVAFSPDGQRIVTCDGARGIKLWEAASGRELLTLKVPTGCVSVIFSADGQRILTRNPTGRPSVWEAARADQVAAWQDEERVAAESIAALKAERKAEEELQRIARERESIKDWLLLGPIPLPPGQSGSKALETEQIPGENWLMPEAGEGTFIGGRALKWREVKLADTVNGFNEVLSHDATQSVAYAACYLRSDTELQDLKLMMDRNAVARAYLNGKKVEEASGIGLGGGIYEPTRVTLSAGLNLVVFKVVSGKAGWRNCSISFTDAEGNPVKGVTVTLNPEAKEKAEVKKP